jgi:hypothetical protein
MNVLSLLKAQWELLGLNAPAFSWLASAASLSIFPGYTCGNDKSQKTDSRPISALTKA